jgi:hypothetical protein
VGIEDNVLRGGAENPLAHFRPFADADYNFIHIFLIGKMDQIFIGRKSAHKKAGFTIDPLFFDLFYRLLMRFFDSGKFFQLPGGSLFHGSHQKYFGDKYFRVLNRQFQRLAGRWGPCVTYHYFHACISGNFQFLLS